MGEQFLREPIESYIFDKLTNMVGTSVEIRAVEIQNAVGGTNRIPQCCNIMRKFMKGNDEELPNNYIKDGRDFSVKYYKCNHLKECIVKCHNM